VLDLIVERLAAAPVERVRRVWLDPLPATLPLDLVLNVSEPPIPGSVTATLGLVDEPAKQRAYPLEWDFTGGSGNLVIVGAPQSGKSTLVRTLIASLSLRYVPGEVAFYCVDYGGGGLTQFEELPHVAGVAVRVDGERVRRVVNEVITLLEAREQLFQEYGLDSAAALRAARARGQVPAEIAGDVFFIVDGWGSFRDDFEVMELALGDVAARGSNYGMHFIVTATQTMQIRMRMQSAFGGRIELRLTDPFDSQVDRKVMGQISKATPGRGLIDGALQFQTALPRVDGGAMEDIGAAQKHLINFVAERWPGSAVPKVQVLPLRYPAEQLPAPDPSGTGVPIGISERDLQPVGVDLEGSDPHLLVYGDGETGKTNLLRLIARGYMRLRDPQRLGIVLVDFRRTMLDAIPPDYLLAYCTAPQQTQAVAAEIAESLRKRIPGPNVTSEQLRNRSWWQGVDVLFAVDDYDLVATQSGNPLLPLLEFIPQARDLGLHVLLARRTGGMARGLLDPVIEALNNLSSPGLLFSGDRMEGRLINGVASQRLPAGRALYAGRGGAAQLIQTAVSPDA
jgi:S-DNA-T family DNA segregation ATPase FtsK/SpoIIIE